MQRIGEEKNVLFSHRLGFRRSIWTWSNREALDNILTHIHSASLFSAQNLLLSQNEVGSHGTVEELGSTLLDL